MKIVLTAITTSWCFGVILSENRTRPHLPLGADAP